MAETIIPFAAPDTQPTRRTALAALAAAPVAGLPAIAECRAGTTTAEDPHVAWDHERRALLDWCNGPEPGDRDLDAIPQFHRLCEVERLIGETPATTPAGVAAQIRLLAYYALVTSTVPDWAKAGLENALAAVERLAGEARS